MKSSHIVTTVIISGAVSILLGYWLGFRHGWQLGLKVEAAPRGVVGMQLGREIDAGDAAAAKYYFESQIDAGLMFWHDVSGSPLSLFLDTLTGAEVYPAYETYIRRLAQYRKSNPSPLWDPKLMAELEANSAGHAPALARELAEGSRDAKKAMDETVSKYAP